MGVTGTEQADKIDLSSEELGPNKDVRANGYGGNDDITGHPIHPNVIDGGTGSDDITGGRAGDEIYGRVGNDKLYGKDGDDRLWGEEGHDFIMAGAGNDDIYGGPGSDKMFGGPGNDWINGYHGNDVLDGGVGVNQLDGGTGADTYRYDAGEVTDAAEQGKLTENMILSLDPAEGDNFMFTGLSSDAARKIAYAINNGGLQALIDNTPFTLAPKVAADIEKATEGFTLSAQHITETEGQHIVKATFER